MSNRAVVALGLVAGGLTAAVLVAAVVAFAPEVPLVQSTPTTQAAATLPAGAGSVASGSPVGSPGPGAGSQSTTPAGSLGGPAPGGPSAPVNVPGASSTAGAGAPSPPVSAAPAQSPSPGASSSLPIVSPSASASSAGPSASTSIGAAFHVGDAAPALSVRQVGGGQIDLAVLRGRPVWIEFMATWCPSCRDDFPLMNGFAARYASNGLVVVAVDVKEDEGAAAAFANSLNASFPIGLDEDGAAARRWDVGALPVHFFVDSAGIIRDGAIGGIGPDLMAQSLRTIMPGVAVSP